MQATAGDLRATLIAGEASPAAPDPARWADKWPGAEYLAAGQFTSAHDDLWGTADWRL
jgi:hypothetical protein